MNAWYSSLANLFVTLYFILLKIPKYLISGLPKHSMCSLNHEVSSKVKPKYWKDLTLLIVISIATISSICFGAGLFVAWNSMKLVLSQFIVNLYLKYNSLNFDTTLLLGYCFRFLRYDLKKIICTKSIIPFVQNFPNVISEFNQC